MGDFRAEIHIKMNLCDKDYQWDADWINFTDETIYRIREFFEDAWQDAQLRYMDELQELWEEEHKAAIEEKERAELARLKDKYDNG